MLFYYEDIFIIGRINFTDMEDILFPMSSHVFLLFSHCLLLSSPVSLMVSMRINFINEEDILFQMSSHCPPCFSHDFNEDIFYDVEDILFCKGLCHLQWHIIKCRMRHLLCICHLWWHSFKCGWYDLLNSTMILMRRILYF